MACCQPVSVLRLVVASPVTLKPTGGASQGVSSWSGGAWPCTRLVGGRGGRPTHVIALTQLNRQSMYGM